MHESDINNRICPGCFTKNYKLLKQRSAASVANEAPRGRVDQGTKRGRDIISKLSRKVVHAQDRVQARAVDGLASLCAVVQEEIEDAMEGKSISFRILLCSSSS